MAGKRLAGDPGRIKPPKARGVRMPALTLPEVWEASMCSVRLIGNCCAMVENHGGLCELGREKISVYTDCGLLQICGCELSLTEVRPDAMVVQGRILRVGYGENAHA